jgi:hypothetical protein
MRLHSLAVVTLLASAATPALSAPTAYTSRAAYDAAVAGLGGAAQPATAHFDDKAAGTAYASGTGTNGLTFTYAISGFQVAVRGGTPTAGGASGLNTLALRNNSTGNAARFTTGDAVQVGFAQPTHAFGFHVVVGQNFDFFAQDVNLTFAGTTYSLTGNETAAPVGSNGAHAIWVGIVDPSAAYTTAAVRFGPVGAGPSSGASFELDDLSTATAVPEPAAAAGLATAAGLLALRRRRHA